MNTSIFRDMYVCCFWADWYEGVECSNVAKNMAAHAVF